MFLLYLLTRLFTNQRELVIWGDEARYLATAKNFYRLWNKSFYDTHPPLYAWLIKIFGKTYKSGILVSFLCSMALYFVSSKLYDVLGLTPYQKLIALTFLTFNYTLIYYSNKIFRYQLIALLGTLMIYFSLTNQSVLAGCSWAYLVLTCTFAGLRGFWIWLLCGVNLIPFLFFLLSMGTWLGIKAHIYSKNVFYPSGLDGKIEPTKHYTFKQLLSPMYFPYNFHHYGISELGFDLKNWHRKIGGMFGLYQLKNKRLTKLLSICTLIMGVFIVKGMTKSPLNLTLLTLILLYPSLMKRFLPRNSIIAIPLLGYFLGKGVPQVPCFMVYLGSLGVLAGFLYLNRNLIPPKPKYQAKAVSAYLKGLPKDGILAEGLIAYAIAYNTDKRVVVIPRTPNTNWATLQTDYSRQYFNLNYAVFSELYLTEKLPYPAIDYLKTFKLLTKIWEDRDYYYVYDISCNSVDSATRSS